MAYYLCSRKKWRKAVLKKQEAWVMSPLRLLFGCLLSTLWTFSSYQNKKTCLCLWSTVLCTMRGTPVPTPPSAGETQFLVCKKWVHTVHSQSAEHCFFVVVFFNIKFYTISGALIRHAVWSERRRREKEIWDGAREGSGAGRRLLMTRWHGTRLSRRRHKGTNVLVILKMDCEMTRLGPHPFCMSHKGRDFFYSLHEK